MCAGGIRTMTSRPKITDVPYWQLIGYAIIVLWLRDMLWALLRV